MRWTNHKLTTLALAYTVTLDPLAAVCAGLGCVFPDSIEMVFQPRRDWSEKPKFSRHHRTWSHWPWPYLAIAVMLFAVAFMFASQLARYAAFLVVGSVLHLAEDLLSVTGIPLKTPYGRKTGLGAYKTFKPSEALVTCGLLAACGASLYWRQELSVDAMAKAAHRAAESAAAASTEVSRLAQWCLAVWS